MVRPPASSLNLPVIRHHLATVIRAAILGAEPRNLLGRTLGAPELRTLLASAAAIDVVAVGKAAVPMLEALHVHLPRPWRSALAIAPGPAPREFPSTTWMVTAHPVPDERSEAAGREALSRASRMGPDDLLLVLLSGGASSLMVVPADGILLHDKREAQATLMRQGADIAELNAVRKHLSAIKGGRLASSTTAHVLTLAMSDVVGDDLATIGSGPAVADPTTFADALAVLARRGGLSRFPAPVVEHLERGVRGEHPETPKALDSHRTQARVVGSLNDALQAAAAAATTLGYRVHRIMEPVVGDARLAGERLLREAASLETGDRPYCVIAGGETTVTVAGSGRGGRNQELALAMVRGLAATEGIAVASIGTDGVDGPTDAAGAMADSTTALRAQERGLDPATYLDDNNSYDFFDALGDLVRTGPTGTNVGDVQIVMMSKESATPR